MSVPHPAAELHLEKEGLLDLDHEVQDALLRTLDALDPHALVEPRAVDRLLEPEQVLFSGRPSRRDRVLAQDRLDPGEERPPDHDGPEAVAGPLDDREAQNGGGVVRVEVHLRLHADIQVAGVAIVRGQRLRIGLRPGVVEGTPPPCS